MTTRTRTRIKRSSERRFPLPSLKGSPLPRSAAIKVILAARSPDAVAELTFLKNTLGHAFRPGRAPKRAREARAPPGGRGDVL